eukprot:TRINITY_DN90547_c0_g1_i1.p1 TRINITY_DN90547_c0_g1~~TRINITY_DN90547_c0_g1_i1.p1  ORF type:complete len:248 (+),score=33.37 TRINITY_DN90547_c0_g1_i1:105-848(+)
MPPLTWSQLEVKELNPRSNQFWINFSFSLFCALFMVYEIYDYADCKAKEQNRPFLHTGAHRYWRIGVQGIGSIILTIVEFETPPIVYSHFLAYFAMLVDAVLLWADKEIVPLPRLLTVAEALMSVLLALGVTDMGRMTTPMLIVVASLRFAQDQWFDLKERHAFKYVNAVLLAALSWHWLPVVRPISDAFNFRHDNLDADVLFLIDIFLGHVTVLLLYRRLAPEVLLAGDADVELYTLQHHGPSDLS